MNRSRLNLWFVYDYFEYVVDNPYYIGNISFKEKHVIKHFEENEIFKLLKDFLELIKIF